MIEDVTAHFSIDREQVYTAGVSGGARVATTIAISGYAKGAIACAAGFPTLDSGVPRRVPFVFFGTAGVEDFNYNEMMRLSADLEDRKAAHRIVFFEGGHTWASAELMMEAVEWLELQAMRTGRRAKDEAFIAGAFASRRMAVPGEPAVERWRALKSLAADFQGLADVAELADEARGLGASRAVMAALKAERALALREDELVERLGHTALESPRRKQKLADELRLKADAADDIAERRMVRRAIAGFLSMARESVRRLFDEAQYDRASAMLEMAVALRPEQPRPWYDLARARAFLSDSKGAVEALERAVKAGFADAARVETEVAFARLREDAGFRAVVASMRRSGGVSPKAVEDFPPPVAILPEAGEPVMLPALRVSAVLASVELRPFYLSHAAGTDLPALSFLRVETVRPNSAAGRAGIAVGMEVTGVQGVRVRGLTELELSRTLAQPAGGEIVLTVREPPSARERDVRIALRRPVGGGE